jgi:hypothetical protein
MGGFNIYAPPAYSGLQQRADAPSMDLAFDYSYLVELTASGNGSALRDQVVAIQNDADFVLRAMILTSYDGAFQIRLSDSQGTYFSNGYLNYANFLSANARVPFPIFPEVLFPKGGKIGIDITNLSGDVNEVEILFRGCKRFNVPR